jgi:hypothetical protein
VTSPLPVGASINARIILGPGKPAKLTFQAPDAVTNPTDVIFNLVFGVAPPNQRTIQHTVTITP